MDDSNYHVHYSHGNKWGKVFKSGPGKICVRQLLKKIFSANFTWPTLEYFVPNDATP